MRRTTTTLLHLDGSGAGQPSRPLAMEIDGDVAQCPSCHTELVLDNCGEVPWEPLIVAFQSVNLG